MAAGQEFTVSELDPLRTVGRHAVVVVLLVVVFGVLGGVYATYRPETYVATASLVLEDPRGATFFGTARAADTERYVANQIALLRSAALAGQASVLSRALGAPRIIGPGELLASAGVGLIAETEFVAITFRAEDPETARVGADAIALAYQDNVRTSLEEEVQKATNSLDSAIDTVIAEIDSLQGEIDAVRAGEEDRADVDAQLSAIISDLARLRGPGPPPDDIGVQVNQLISELQARLVIGELDAQQGGAAVLLRRQEDALELLSELNLRRGDIAVEAGLAGDGVVQYTPAGPGRPTGISLFPAVTIAGVLGGLLGLGYAYWAEGSRSTFSSRLEPDRIIGAPLLAQIPDFGEEGLRSLLPVRDSPATVSAEAFRFLMVGLETSRKESSKEAGEPGSDGRQRIIAFVSATVGDGKTTVVANTALAAAQEGLRVLVVDADIGSQELSGSLLADESRVRRAGLGITDMVIQGASFASAVNVISAGDGAPLSVLRYGRSDADPIAFFRSEQTATILDSLSERHDLLIVDVPPILHVAYAAALLRLVDDVVVVVPHGGEYAQLRDLRDQLGLLGIQPIGYVYNRAPLGKKTAREGSLVSTPG